MATHYKQRITENVITFKSLDDSSEDLPAEVEDVEPTPLIYNASEFLAISKKPSGNYKLMKNIVLPTGSGKAYIDTFSGKFDGNGHTIKTTKALFGIIESDAKVQNVNVNIGNISNLPSNPFGLIANENWGEISGCESAGSIKTEGGIDFGPGKGVIIGGLCGENWGVVKYCKNAFTVSLSEYDIYGVVVRQGYPSVAIGGIVGWNDGNITHCLNEADLAIKIYDLEMNAGHIGGISGGGNKLSYGVTDCASSANKVVMSTYLYTGSGQGHVYSGFIYGDEYKKYFDATKDIPIVAKNCFVKEGSYVDVNVDSDYNTSHCRAQAKQSAYTVKSVSEIQNWWKETIEEYNNQTEKNDKNKKLGVCYFNTLTSQISAMSFS